MLAVGELIFCLEKTDGLCTIALYFYRIGFILIILGLLVKNYRIYRIFSNRNATTVFISETKLLLVLGAITLLDLIFITVMVAIFGFYAVLHKSDYDEFYYYYMCGFEQDGVEKFFKLSVQITQSILVLINLILAFLSVSSMIVKGPCHLGANLAFRPGLVMFCLSQTF